MEVSDGTQFVFGWVARVMGDNNVGARWFSVNVKAEFVFLLLNCDIEKVNFVVGKHI
jgi:hypothetical protein